MKRLSENVAAIVEEKEFLSRLALADMVRRNPRVIHKLAYFHKIAGELPEEMSEEEPGNYAAI